MLMSSSSGRGRPRLVAVVAACSSGGFEVESRCVVRIQSGSCGGWCRGERFGGAIVGHN